MSSIEKKLRAGLPLTNEEMAELEKAGKIERETIRIHHTKIPTGMVTIPIEATETDVAYILETAKKGEELRKRERSIIEALRILGDWHLICYEHFETPYPTADEFKQKAERLSISGLNEELTKWKKIVEKCETFENFIMGKLRDELKDQPIHTESFETMKFEGDKTDKKVAWFLKNYQEACRLLIMNPLFLRDIPGQVSQVKEAIPFFREILDVFHDVLNQKLRTLEEQRKNAQKIISQITNIVTKAQQIVKDIENAGAKFNKEPRQKCAKKIKELTDELNILEDQYKMLCEKVNFLRNELSIPNFPSIPVGLYSQSDFKLALTGYWG